MPRAPVAAGPVTAGAPVLTIERAWKRYQATGRGHHVVTAVAGASLIVPAGGAVALVGESGSGKTTLLRMAAGLVRPDEGSVRWDESAGRPQLIYQDAGASLTPWMTVGDLVNERLVLRGVPAGEAAARTLDYLQLVGLDARTGRSRPRELSGGQRQRAAIARALASQPRLLLCDEPVSALDASLSIRILRLLEGLRDELGLALLIVTHDLAAAQYLADEVYVMYHGEIVERAPTERLFRAPAHPYSRGLLAAVPRAEPGRLMATLDGEPPDPFEALSGCPFAPRCPIVADRCRSEAPALRVLGDGSSAACHFASS